mmetsp:Transcript_23395/g.72887  ORF Transcript_23395/g.72887 Transcript_23395/m.72887 type:complete len:224 (-) Transcript_23395:135-806(-)
MGCGGSQFTEDPDKFFKKTFESVNPLSKDIVNKSEILKVALKKAMSDEREDCVIKTSDGADLVKCVAGPGRKKLYTMKDELICVLVFSVHYSEVNAVDAAFNLPHVYVYTLRPYKDGQEPAEIKEGEKALYMWARIHKVSNIGVPKFELALAEFQGSPKGPNLEKFGYMAYRSTLFPDGRMEIKKESDGCCRVEFADGGKDVYTVSMALMLCCVMGMESLKER